MKKILIMSIIFISLLPIVLAQDSQNYKIEISTSQDIFNAGDPITLKVTLLDSNNNPIKDNLKVTLEDAEKRIKVEKEIPSNEFIDIDINIDKIASYGQGTITATYKGLEVKDFFEIAINELANFYINKETNELIITNIGNTKYTKTIQITIGQTTGTKYPKLNIGESVKYKLVAPDGVYNIKVTDGKTSLTEGEVTLTGTGKVIGALDQTPTTRSPVTGVGGRNPSAEDDETILSYMKNSKFTYIFIFVIFGAAILLAIERRYKKKIRE